MAKNWNLFPSPRGDKLQPAKVCASMLMPPSTFPSPRGDKLQQQNCTIQFHCFL